MRVFFSGYEKRDRGKGKRRLRYVESERFSYVIESDTGADVLVIANEDYTGVNPDYPDEVTAPKYAQAHVQAIEDAGYSADVWDVDEQGVPHDLGVLSHYDAVLWYLGDNRITQDPEDELIQTPAGNLPGHRGRRAPAVPDDERARLPERGRQAGARRRDRAVQRAARDLRHRRRPLLRAQRRRDGRVRGRARPRASSRTA